ncbi:MAG: hypothetical protein U5J63_16730 [Fodinibius sp.]|nr:hypothetical protein [Fodinibius sp.]
MEKLVLKSAQSNFFSNVLRYVFGGIGLLYLFMSISELYPDWNFATGAVLNGILGLGLFVMAIFNPTFGANIQITLNEKFLRATEDLSLIRTAYWNNIGKIMLNQFSIRIYYKSGTVERFRLPYLNNDELEALRNYIQKMSTAHNFELEDKAWWKIF